MACAVVTPVGEGSGLMLYSLCRPGHVKVMASDEWAHVVLMAALEHTDDTALLRKTLVPELLVRFMRCASPVS